MPCSGPRGARQTTGVEPYLWQVTVEPVGSSELRKFSWYYLVDRQKSWIYGIKILVVCFVTWQLTLIQAVYKIWGGKGRRTFEWGRWAHHHCIYRGADKSLARPGRKQANVSVRMAWISFGAVSLTKKKNLTARVSMLLKSRASLTCFRACFLPGRAKDLSTPRYLIGHNLLNHEDVVWSKSYTRCIARLKYTLHCRPCDVSYI